MWLLMDNVTPPSLSRLTKGLLGGESGGWAARTSLSPDYWYSWNLGSPGLSWWLSGKESSCNAEDAGSIPGSIWSPGEENGNPLQYSCLGNLMERGSWQATVHRVTKNWTQLSMRSSEQHGHWGQPFKKADWKRTAKEECRGSVKVPICEGHSPDG